MRPFISALCPTYRRRRLLQNAIACFIQQDYPVDRRELIILDDAGEILPQSGVGWKVISVTERFPNLPSKYNELARLADPRSDFFVIFEDDDVYLPHHLTAHSMAMEGASWSKPSSVLSTYSGTPQQEPSRMRFFASVGIRRVVWEQIGGIPETLRADFDQQFLASLQRSVGPPADTLTWSPGRLPSYCFRWATTGAYHGQAHMQSAEDEEWYLQCADYAESDESERLMPQLDDESMSLFAAAESLQR